MGEFIFYQSSDGKTRVQLRAEEGSVWLTQVDIAELFASSKQNISLHIRNILNSGELMEEAVVKENLTTANDGKTYNTKLYRLEMILAVGFRVKGVLGTQFRQWASANLSQYLIKGFIMDDERLKNPAGWDYFDELLARIRDIRASEQRFYQKVRDLFALSRDYQEDPQAAQVFFAEVQNKLLYAVTRQTAAELVLARADASAPNMALTAWQGSVVRKADVSVAKNYLNADEVDTLNRLVVIFLDQAELRAKGRQDLTLEYWRQNVDKMLEFNERPVLRHAGKISHAEMKIIVSERYDSFDSQRKKQQANAADEEDLRLLLSLETQAKHVKKKS